MSPQQHGVQLTARVPSAFLIVLLVALGACFSAPGNGESPEPDAQSRSDSRPAGSADTAAGRDGVPDCWTCPHARYDEGSDETDCDCGCGCSDPDCESADFEDCEWNGCVANGTAPPYDLVVDQENTTQCVPNP